MNLYNLTDDDLAQLRTIPASFRACPHWDNRIRFFEMKGKSYVLFCCNRPDLNGDSEPIGEGVQRAQECVLEWTIIKISSQRLAFENPIIAYMDVNTRGKEERHVLMMANDFKTNGVEECWRKANEEIDKLLEENSE